MIYLFTYFIILLFIWYFNRSNSLASIFRSTKKTHWLVASMSLFMLGASIDKVQLYSGLIADKGVWGLWLLWVSLISVAVVPIVFAPLWAKLNLITDNQFILFRFSGDSARFLHKFRAVYVGGIIVAFSLSFQTIAFSRIIQVYYQITSQQAILITGGILSIFALKNSFANKFKSDVFHSILYFIALGIIFYSLYNASGGLSNVLIAINSHSPDTLRIFPPIEDRTLWYSLFLYLGVQWWSATMFDGGGTEMSRYTAAGTRWRAIKAGLSPILLNLFITLILIVMALFSYANSNFSNNGELSFVISVFESVPGNISGLVLLGFFAVFITSAESSLNWGASFLTIDWYKAYLVKNKSEKHYTRISFISMLLLSISSLFIALNVNSLEVLIKIVFSISAGVAPVFILRWFWMRINAWSQLSAMFSSGLYTILFYVVQDKYHNFFEHSALQTYEWRLIVVTLLTSITWLLVTFLTPQDDKETIARFREILPTKSVIIKSFIVAFALGIGVLLMTVLGVYFIVL